MCGIVGVFGSPKASQEAYQALLLLQHRGQDAAGIISLDQFEQFHMFKEKGLVDQVFDLEKLKNLPGNLALGHTRYSTIGLSHVRDIQPLTVNFPFGISMVHNGNVVNAPSLREELTQQKRRHLFSQNDVEILLNLFAEVLAQDLKIDHSIDFPIIQKAVKAIFAKAHGGYSVVGSIAYGGLIAFRDPQGIRPLVWGERNLTAEERSESHGKRDKSFCFASESNVLSYLGYKIIRDVAPGEIIFVDKNGVVHSSTEKKANKPCMFEWVYFANPEAVMEEKGVYSARLNMGKNLAQIVKDRMEQGLMNPDIVVPVPDTSRPSATALAESLGLPYREILIKNRYIQRSFILNTPEQRSRAVNLKLTPVKNEFKDKKVLLVDDSIVRGTTSKHLVRLVREAGAKEVYLASTCPPIRFPCFYGIDFPDPNELVATGRSEEEIAKILGADQVIYLDVESLKKSIGLSDLCLACLDGKYPVDISEGEKFRQTRCV